MPDVPRRRRGGRPHARHAKRQRPAHASDSCRRRPARRPLKQSAPSPLDRARARARDRVPFWRWRTGSRTRRPRRVQALERAISRCASRPRLSPGGVNRLRGTRRAGAAGSAPCSASASRGLARPERSSGPKRPFRRVRRGISAGLHDGEQGNAGRAPARVPLALLPPAALAPSRCLTGGARAGAIALYEAVLVLLCCAPGGMHRCALGDGPEPGRLAYFFWLVWSDGRSPLLLRTVTHLLLFTAVPISFAQASGEAAWRFSRVFAHLAAASSATHVASLSYLALYGDSRLSPAGRLSVRPISMRRRPTGRSACRRVDSR